MIATILKVPFLRKKFLFWLKYKYFHELEFSIPIGSGYHANLLECDAYDSFAEIFIRREYDSIIEGIKFHNGRILDIGAHYGYFSLWLQSQNPQLEIHSLLIEPSLQCMRSLKTLSLDPKVNRQFTILNRIIGDPLSERSSFYERPFMAGSSIANNDDEHPTYVKTLQIREITKYAPPPYDLVKCDIEGAEWQLLTNYSEILVQSRYLLMEWHSWHNGHGGLPQIKKKLNDLGFIILRSSPHVQAIGRDGEVGLTLAENKNFNR